MLDLMSDGKVSFTGGSKIANYQNVHNFTALTIQNQRISTTAVENKP